MREPYHASSAAVLIYPPLGQLTVSVHAAIAQKRPMRARDLYFAQIDRHDERLLLVGAGPREDFSGSAGDKTLTPEFQSLSAGRFFQADAIGRGHVAAVGHGVAALDEFPGVVLLRAVAGLLPGVPADRGGIKQDLRAPQRRQPRRFRIPLVPADEHADLAEPGLPGAKAKIARREIEFFAVERIVRDVHLAVNTQQRAVRVDDGGGVVIESGGAFFEQGNDDDHALALRQSLKRFRGGAGNRFGEFEIGVVFALAKIKRAEQFLGADELGALPGGAPGEGEGFLKISLLVRRTLGLQQPEFHDGRRSLHAVLARRVRAVCSINWVLPLASEAASCAVWPKSSRIILPSVSLVGP